MASGSGTDANAAAIERIRAGLVDATARLAAAGARTEALAEYEAPGRVLLIPRAERLRPIGRVWRLGVILLGVTGGRADGGGDDHGADAPPTVYATGSVTRSHEPGRPTYQAASAERRRQLRVAAYRGRFAQGESVNYDAEPIALDESLVGSSGVLTVMDGHALVRWSPSDPGATTDFDGYVADRVGLLVDPPAGA
ncbi:hypothetical protein GCM10027568_23970 [Humibacter soli]